MDKAVEFYAVSKFMQVVETRELPLTDAVSDGGQEGGTLMGGHWRGPEPQRAPQLRSP